MSTIPNQSQRVSAAEVAARLAAGKSGVLDHDSWYSLNLRRRLSYANEPGRLGFIHCNSREEVDRLVARSAPSFAVRDRLPVAVGASKGTDA